MNGKLLYLDLKNQELLILIILVFVFTALATIINLIQKYVWDQDFTKEQATVAAVNQVVSVFSGVYLISKIFDLI